MPPAPIPLSARTAVLDTLLVRTPTVPLADARTGCTIWVKLEYLQPSGSTKDRLAVFVLRDAIARGAVHEDSLVVEASSGSTSIAFAMVCARLGLRFRAVMPEGVSRERVLIIRRYGGEVVLTDPAQGIVAAMAATEAMATTDPNVYLPRQFANPANVEAHAVSTGPELLETVGGGLDGFVAGVGTAGTLMGVARAIRASGMPGTRIAAVRPTVGTGFAGQPEICAGFSTGIPGVVEGMSTLLAPDEVALEEPIDVADDLAMAAARRAVRGRLSGRHLERAEPGRRPAAREVPRAGPSCCDRPVRPDGALLLRRSVPGPPRRLRLLISMRLSPRPLVALTLAVALLGGAGACSKKKAEDAGAARPATTTTATVPVAPPTIPLTVTGVDAYGTKAPDDATVAAVKATLDAWLAAAVVAPLHSGQPAGDLSAVFTPAALEQLADPATRATLVDEGLPPATKGITAERVTAGLFSVAGADEVTGVVAAQVDVKLRAVGDTMDVDIVHFGEVVLVPEGDTWKIDSFALDAGKDSRS